jgi:hypothetical protein
MDPACFCLNVARVDGNLDGKMGSRIGAQFESDPFASHGFQMKLLRYGSLIPALENR